MNKPILVLQMQRMGDLILTFPLLSMLHKKYPDNPLWTVAEPQFFSDLMPLAPQTTFFPPSAAARLAMHEYFAVVNVSHRMDAARIAGSVRAEHYFGARMCDGVHSIQGHWALYRASIVQNNRYNLFHWSDLQLLDHVSDCLVPMQGSEARVLKGDKVGIFVGASEVEKRPSLDFFAQLATALMRKKLRPVFFGGPDDVALGAEVEKRTGVVGASLCGKLSLMQLATVMQDLALFITADTGPMHLAAWMKTPVLNMSLGPVNPWETGPLFCGHHVIQPALSCAGCWEACGHYERCQKKLSAQRVALLAHTLVFRPQSLSTLRMAGHRVFRTVRDECGLYSLEPQCQMMGRESVSVRSLLARFWQSWFWFRLQEHDVPPTENIQRLWQHAPRMMEKLQKAIVRLGQGVRRHIVRKSHACALSETFWQEFPLLLRPLTGYIDVFLQNTQYSQEGWNAILQEIEMLVAVVRR